MTPLTDAELTHLHDRVGENDGDLVHRLVDEVRAARALLSTPFECGWGSIQIERQVGERQVGDLGFPGRNVAHWRFSYGQEVREMQFDEDEALSIRASLIRSALSARGGVP